MPPLAQRQSVEGSLGTRADRPSSSGRHRLVFVSGGATMAGVEYNTLRLTKRLHKSRWEPIVLCPEEGDLPNACRKAGVEVLILPRPKLFSTSIRIGRRWRLPNPAACGWDMGVILLAARNLARLLTDLRPDLVVTKGMFPHFYGGLAARWARVPCLWHAEDFISERWWGLFRRVFG